MANSVDSDQMSSSGAISVNIEHFLHMYGENAKQISQFVKLLVNRVVTRYSRIVPTNRDASEY